MILVTNETGDSGETDDSGETGESDDSGKSVESGNSVSKRISVESDSDLILGEILRRTTLGEPLGEPLGLGEFLGEILRRWTCLVSFWVSVESADFDSILRKILLRLACLLILWSIEAKFWGIKTSSLLNNSLLRLYGGWNRVHSPSKCLVLFGLYSVKWPYQT